MKVTGKVTNKTENASGHSQVRISAVAQLDAGSVDALEHQVEVILSTPSAEVVAAFKLGQSVSFEL